MKIRFRGFNNPVVIPNAEPLIVHPRTLAGLLTVGKVYEASQYESYGAPDFHALGEPDGFIPDMRVTDDKGHPFYAESLYWDLVEE